MAASLKKGTSSFKIVLSSHVLRASQSTRQGLGQSEVELACVASVDTCSVGGHVHSTVSWPTTLDVLEAEQPLTMVLIWSEIVGPLSSYINRCSLEKGHDLGQRSSLQLRHPLKGTDS